MANPSSVALGLISKKIANFEVITKDVTQDVDLANKATWVYQVSNAAGKVLKTGNYLACLFYKYKHGGSLSQISNGQKSISDAALLKDVAKKEKDKSYVTDYDYGQYFDKEQKVLGESSMGKVTRSQLPKKKITECFIFIDRSAKTLKESIITESDDILAALDNVQDKSITGVQDAYADLIDLDILPDNAVVIVVDDNTIDSVGSALDAWVDDKLATHQIEPDMFMANRGATHEFYQDNEEIIEQPNNAVALGLAPALGTSSSESDEMEAYVRSLLGEDDDSIEDADEGAGDGELGGEDFEESFVNPALKGLQHGSMRETKKVAPCQKKQAKRHR